MTEMYTPIQASGIEHQINRAYREGLPFQWARETLQNAIEAGATRVEFGVEREGALNEGVFRRTIVDDGEGMTAKELVAFFNQYGGGKKPIGMEYNNFGIGSKTSLLPWNPLGVVVLSWSRGEASMIRLRRYANGEYGIHQDRDAEGAITDFVNLNDYDEFFYDDLDVDWTKVKPKWIEDHGTMLVLLGSHARQDTVLGDPTEGRGDESGRSDLVRFLNNRYWDASDVSVWVAEFSPDPKYRDSWAIPLEAGERGRKQGRNVYGMRHYIEGEGLKTKSKDVGRVVSRGTVPLSDGTEIDWYLWGDGRFPETESYAGVGGFIATLHDGELYERSSHHQRYRSFGIIGGEVYKRLWLIIRPRGFDAKEYPEGVMPTSSRNTLIRGGLHSSDNALPYDEWADEFRMKIPDGIHKALVEARTDNSAHKSKDMERLFANYARRWRAPLIFKDKNGTHPDPTGGSGGHPRRRLRRGGSGGGGSTGDTTRSLPTGSKQGKGGSLNPGSAKPLLPEIDYKMQSEMGEGWEPGAMVSYERPSSVYPNGVIVVVRDHPVIESQIAHHASQYPDHHFNDIATAVMDKYAVVAASKVAHMESMRKLIPSPTVDKFVNDPMALTYALLGCIAEDALIAPSLGHFGRKVAV